MSRMSFYLKERAEEVKQSYLNESRRSKKLPKWEKIVITWVMVLVFWLIVSGEITWQTVLVGGSVAILISLMVYENLTDDLRIEGNVLKKIIYLIIFQVPQYIFIMVFHLIESNMKVAKHALFMDINPGIIRISTGLRSDTGITIMANSITLTPGTLTIDTKKTLDRTYLYVHWIDMKTMNIEKAGNEIKGDVERWLKKIFW
ncbi:MAG: Na+/H+ antiporter subunit E [Thermoplasmatota archaeon]